MGAERFVDEGFVFWRQRGADFRELFELRTQVMLDDEYLQSVTTNINERRMRLIIAADVIPSGLRRTIEFLHESATLTCTALRCTSSRSTTLAHDS